MSAQRQFGSIRPLPSGRFQARYVGPDGARYTAPIRYTTRALASKALAKIETSISDGSWSSPKVAVETVETFAQYAEAWLAKRDLTPRTRGLYASQLRRFLVPTFGARTLDQITPASVHTWWSELPATPTQNAQAYTLLHTILGTAVKVRKIEFNPCNIDGAAKVRRAKTITVLTPEEVMDLAVLVPKRYRALVLLTAFGALRFGEVTELRRSDVVGGRVKVRRGVTWVDGQHVVGRPKTVAGVREIPISTSLRKIITEHMLEFAEAGDDGLLFPALGGGHVSHSTASTVLYAARTDLGKPDLTWHHLRHTGAVMFAQDPTLNLKDLMGLLGHETADMALRYQHAVDGKLDAAAENLDRHFSVALESV